MEGKRDGKRSAAEERDDPTVAVTRKKYRQGRKLTAVKVYTVNQESRYLIVRNVPALGASDELLKLFGLYGTVVEHHMLDSDAAADKYHDTVWLKYRTESEARVAKRKLDDFNFLGKLLRVSYVPEYETMEETREKLEGRERDVLVRLKNRRRHWKWEYYERKACSESVPTAGEMEGTSIEGVKEQEATASDRASPPPPPPRLPTHDSLHLPEYKSLTAQQQSTVERIRAKLRKVP